MTPTCSTLHHPERHNYATGRFTNDVLDWLSQRRGFERIGTAAGGWVIRHGLAPHHFEKTPSGQVRRVSAVGSTQKTAERNLKVQLGNRASRIT